MLNISAHLVRGSVVSCCYIFCFIEGVKACLCDMWADRVPFRAFPLRMKRFLRCCPS